MSSSFVVCGACKFQDENTAALATKYTFLGEGGVWSACHSNIESLQYLLQTWRGRSKILAKLKLRLLSRPMVLGLLSTPNWHNVPQLVKVFGCSPAHGHNIIHVTYTLLPAAQRAAPGTGQFRS